MCIYLFIYINIFSINQNISTRSLIICFILSICGSFIAIFVMTLSDDEVPF